MIFQSERQRSALDCAVKHVRRLRPGERIGISRSLLDDIGRMEHNGARWNPADRVLENIVGSSYEFRYDINPASLEVMFERLAMPLTNGCKSYVSPDRRHLYHESLNGIWMPVVNQSGTET